MCKLKYAQETELWIKENSTFERKWDKFQIKAQKSSQLISFWEICWPVWETGRLVSYPGELVCMWVQQPIGDRLHWLLILRFLFFATLYNVSHQSGTCCSTSFPGFSPTLTRREPWERGCRLLCTGLSRNSFHLLTNTCPVPSWSRQALFWFVCPGLYFSN